MRERLVCRRNSHAHALHIAAVATGVGGGDGSHSWWVGDEPKWTLSMAFMLRFADGDPRCVPST